MIKQIVEISETPAHLRVRHEQLEITVKGKVIGRIPCEDLGVLIVDNQQATFSHYALVRLGAYGTVVVLCDDAHHPSSMVLPLPNHSQVVTRLKLQIDVSAPTKKRIWKQIVISKISGQAENLQADSAPRKRLVELARTVRTGDPQNHEAQAAKIYWQSWLHDLREQEEFRRSRYGDAPNNLLNYGYAIYRAAIARAIVAAGLHPSIGVKHIHRSNVFCLADDLVEPLRPIVDQVVRELYSSGHVELDRYAKSMILESLTQAFSVSHGKGPLLVQLNRYLASFVRCLEDPRAELEIPQQCTSSDIEICG
ncbi:type II CRISPR-associated endonuclease Cas1 [Rubinisphaera margarita]|uniref:type II CRISPR-associated endonuclease Cas1 n=1 Tax=Rubinisphaera margarita TaxID=2909586 RepID=UPI001EE8D4D4|nr:type II CRISPR-associated endonuclease Cas1 [Rubinisphaera margarita]MCG6154660.1 type II CRISPR-associated endonuclease Cas1 [Rubinisphaera margarita]